MPKEILLYQDIYSYTAREFVQSVAALGDEDLVVRVNSDGGEVRYGWGIIGRFRAHPGKKKVTNDGVSSSMSAYLFAYADEAEAYDVSTFNLHRAAVWYEDEELLFTPEDKARLEEINKNLRTALEAKIDVAKFNALGRGTLDEMFSMDKRINVRLSAQEAKDIGLINKIIPITPERKQVVARQREQAMAMYSGIPVEAKSESQTTTNTKQMDINELKDKHPDTYKAVTAEALKKEKARIEAWMAFNDVDPVAVAKGVESGEEISMKQVIELNRKQFSADALKKICDEGAPPIETGAQGAGATPDAKTAEAKKKEADILAFEKAADARLGLTKEAK